MPPDAQSQDPNQVQSLPPQILQQAQLGPMAGTQPAPQQGPSPLPPSSPVQGAPLDPQQIAAQAMQQGTQMTGQQLGISNRSMQGATDIAQSPYQTPDPRYGLGPSQPGFFHHLGHALLQIAAATTPGQTVMAQKYAGQVSARKSEEEGRAERISALQKQGETAEQSVGAVAHMGPAYMQASARETSAEASADRAKSYGDAVKNHLQTALAGLDLKKIQVGSQVDLNKAREALMALKPVIDRERIAMEGKGIDVRSATQQAVANLLAEKGIEQSHPLTQLFDSVFGTSLTPAAPQTPAGAGPEKGSRPLPNKGDGSIYARDPQGVLHKAKPGTALPKGWKPEKSQ